MCLYQQAEMSWVKYQYKYIDVHGLVNISFIQVVIYFADLVIVLMMQIILNVIGEEYKFICQWGQK